MRSNWIMRTESPPKQNQVRRRSETAGAFETPDSKDHSKSGIKRPFDYRNTCYLTTTRAPTFIALPEWLLLLVVAKKLEAAIWKPNDLNSRYECFDLMFRWGPKINDTVTEWRCPPPKKIENSFEDLNSGHLNITTCRTSTICSILFLLVKFLFHRKNNFTL